MPRDIPSYLKLHTEESPQESVTRRAPFASLANLCRSFHQATGWELRFEATDRPAEGSVWSAPVPAEDGAIAGHLALWCNDQEAQDQSPHQASDGNQARELAAEIGRLLSELQTARRVVWEREAELAAGVPITPRPDEEAHLAVRLENVLRGGAESVDCFAAAAYLLDDATSLLKLRASRGLPKDRFFEPPRPLRGELADLEALLGHAVVLENTALSSSWNSPHPCASAVCLPISSPTTPLGTIWFFGRKARDYSNKEVNILEIVAGRVASELEREMLLQQGVQSRQLDRQLMDAAVWQNKRQPNIAPLLDNWEVAAWSSQAEWMGGDFYDWTILPDGNLALTVGDAEGQSLPAALTATGVQSAVRALGHQRHNARQMLSRVNDTLWTGSMGDEFASLFYCLVNTETGDVDCSSAGRTASVVVRSKRCERLVRPGPILGASPDSNYMDRQAKLQAGEFLIAFSGGVQEVRDARGERPDPLEIARRLRKRQSDTADELAAEVRTMLEEHRSDPIRSDLTVMVLKRTS